MKQPTPLLPQGLVSVALLGTALAAAAPEGPPGATPVDLETKIYRSWKIRLPAEAWEKVGKAIKVPALGDSVFRAQLDGTSLVLDTDGDGTLETTIDDKGGVVTLRKGDLRLAIRLRSKPDWSFAPASVKSGQIEGTRVRLIDQNNNGRFDDVGQDAMVIGVGKTASFLSKVVRVGDKLFSISVEGDGSRLSYAPYTGATGTLDFKLLSKGKVLAAVLKSTDGQFSFDVSQQSGALTLPAADYALHSGLLSFGGNKVSVRQGRAAPIALAAGKAAEVRLGGPLTVEFSHKVLAGNRYEFSPQAIWYFGRAGEEYHDWQPLGKSPKITVDDPKSGDRIAEVIFPPNC